MEYCLLQDETLIRLLRTDDQAALRELYLRYWKRLYQSALRKIRNREMAEELIQNIFVSLWERRQSLQIGHLCAYFDKAVKYQVINCLKSRIIDRKRLQQAGLSAAAGEGSSESVLLTHELSLAIDRAIRELPPRTQLVFRLSRYENRTIREISQSMNISEKAVEYHITRSLRIMRVRLKDFILLGFTFLSYLLG